MDSFSVETRLTAVDWQAFVRAATARASAATPKRVVWIFVGTLTVCVSLGWLLGTLGHHIDALSAWLGVLVVSIYLLWTRRFARAMAPSDDGALRAATTLDFSSDGIRSTQPGLTSFTSWSRVKDVDIAREHLFVWLDRAQALIVPLRDMPAFLAIEEARARIESWIAAGATATASPAAAPERVTANHERVVRFPTSDAAIVVFAMSSFATWIGIDWIRVGPDVDFAYWNAPSLAWYACSALLLTGVFARVSTPSMRLRHALSVVLASLPFVIASIALIDLLLDARWHGPAVVACALLLAAYLARASRVFTGSARVGAIGAVFVFAVLWYAAGQRIYVDGSMWVAREDTSMEDWRVQARRHEQVVFEQPLRIDAAIEQVTPSTEAPAAFFVGFAGVGEQKVFAEEIKFAAATFAKRFDTAARTVELVNDARDESPPMASVPGLSYALRRLATKMHVERDVLILALSSHGSSSHKLSVSNGEGLMADLTAEDIHKALDDAGIKWRVIVISACYAGSFFEQLADDRSIVIAAAGAHQKSHGCSNTRDLTWFGEAFYRDALPRATSIRNAYELARDTIAQREALEGIEQSHPQALFGSQVEEKLDALDRGPLRNDDESPTVVPRRDS